jgi:hypothetical protein
MINVADQLSISDPMVPRICLNSMDFLEQFQSLTSSSRITIYSTIFCTAVVSIHQHELFQS